VAVNSGNCAESSQNNPGIETELSNTHRSAMATDSIPRNSEGDEVLTSANSPCVGSQFPPNWIFTSLQYLRRIMPLFRFSIPFCRSSRKAWRYRGTIARMSMSSMIWSSDGEDRRGTKDERPVKERRGRTLNPAGFSEVLALKEQGGVVTSEVRIKCRSSSTLILQFSLHLERIGCTYSFSKASGGAFW